MRFVPMVCGERLQPSLIHQVWEVIEQTQSVLLMQWSDPDLVSQLLCQVQQVRPLNRDEQHHVHAYLAGRTSLIRDVVSERRGVVF